MGVGYWGVRYRGRWMVGGCGGGGVGGLPMAVEHAPEHPVACYTLLALLRRRNARRDFDDFLIVVVLDGVVARDLDDVISPDAAAPANDIAFLVAAQLLSGLLRGQHFDDLAPAVVDLL